MLAKRIIPCLDVKNDVVVKGIRFRDHQIVGDIIDLALRYVAQGADELVFYDITASSDNRSVSNQWIQQVAQHIDIPFCVAGGIRDIETARAILAAGADKISINSPALENPNFISELADIFGSQCVVVGIDSFEQQNNYWVYQYTGDPQKTRVTNRNTMEWALAAQDLGAGEIVLNCMNKDGVRQGYDVEQLKKLKSMLKIPVIASGGAGNMEHFKDVFNKSGVDGALAASVFHNAQISIQDLKKYLREQQIEVRL